MFRTACAELRRVFAFSETRGRVSRLEYNFENALKKFISPADAVFHDSNFVLFGIFRSKMRGKFYSPFTIVRAVLHIIDRTVSLFRVIKLSSREL